MKKIIGFLFLLAAGLVQAQTPGNITFSVEITTANNGTVTPKLTWSTTPAATSCTGSSGWSGTKAASGTETLAPVGKSAVYRIDCSWSGDNKATLTWVPPTTNTDGSALTDLGGYRVWYGTSATTLNTAQTVTGASSTTTTISPLSAGKWFFAVEAFTNSGAESLLSTVVSKTTTDVSTGTKSVTLSVNIPNPPTNLTVQ